MTATHTTISDLGREAQSRGCNFTTVWEACESPIYRVVDEEGNNVADAQIRHFLGRNWLYVDDTDGFALIHENDASKLILIPA